MQELNTSNIDISIRMIEQFKNRPQYFRLNDDRDMFLASNLQRPQDGINFLLRLIEAHVVSGILHP